MDNLREVIEMKYTADMIKKIYIGGQKLKFVFFWGNQPRKDGKIDKSCLSQWWLDKFEVDGITYSCMEQYMMASKARLFGDEEIIPEIMAAKAQKTIKDLGRKVKHFDSEVWDKYKYSIVYRGNIQKFSQNEKLKEYLLSTKDKILVEASPYDTIWGIGLSEDDEKAQIPPQWKGTNLLGFALMQVRDEIRKKEQK